MTQPPYLQKGDTIGLIAPARKISREEIAFALNTFSRWGLKTKLGKNLYGACNQFSGTDEERASDMQDMLDDESVKAIISVRGGYGCLRIVDKLDFSRFLKAPKWMIGYSDVTVFHSHLHTMGVETLHATMPFNFGQDAESTESLRRALFGEVINYTWDSNPLNRKGEASGQLIGGNLSLLYALSGSKSDMDTKYKILFLEDLDEYLYHIDRMMLNLKRSGKLEHLSGLIVGGMTSMKDNTVPFGKTAEEIILDAVKEYKYPVCFDFSGGHVPRNLALIFSAEVKLYVAGESRLHFIGNEK
jgi:muramoyltetrapeptide carboxypeptidase